MNLFQNYRELTESIAIGAYSEARRFAEKILGDQGDEGAAGIYLVNHTRSIAGWLQGKDDDGADFSVDGFACRAFAIGRRHFVIIGHPRMGWAYPRSWREIRATVASRADVGDVINTTATFGDEPLGITWDEFNHDSAFTMRVDVSPFFQFTIEVHWARQILPTDGELHAIMQSVLGVIESDRYTPKAASVAALANVNQLRPSFGVRLLPDLGYTWNDAHKYGFIIAAVRPSRHGSIHKISQGAFIFVHIRKQGFIGVGIALGSPKPLSSAEIRFDGASRSLLELVPSLRSGQSGMNEFAIPVRWLRSLKSPLTQLYAHRRGVWEVRSLAKQQELIQAFGVEREAKQ